MVISISKPTISTSFCNFSRVFWSWGLILICISWMHVSALIATWPPTRSVIVVPTNFLSCINIHGCWLSLTLVYLRWRFLVNIVYWSCAFSLWDLLFSLFLRYILFSISFRLISFLHKFIYFFVFTCGWLLLSIRLHFWFGHWKDLFHFTFVFFLIWYVVA